MNKIEFVKIIAPVAEYYGRTLSDAAIAVYYQAAKEIDVSVFEHLVQAHIADPNQGKFFPTLSHLFDQAGNASDVERQASLAFLNNPRIDGTGTFDCQNESKFDKNQRQKDYVRYQVEQWQNLSPLRRIAQSPKIPLSLRQKMLALEVLNHE